MYLRQKKKTFNHAAIQSAALTLHRTRMKLIMQTLIKVRVAPTTQAFMKITYLLRWDLRTRAIVPSDLLSSSCLA